MGMVVCVAAFALGDFVDVSVEFDELIRDVYQPRAGVAPEARQFDSYSLVGDSVYRIREILVA
jgi:hypothetical protein